VTRLSPSDRLCRFALGLPESWEDFPWGDHVVKVAKKIFVFLGTGHDSTPRLTVKLEGSHPAAMAVPGAAPTAYGLGRAGWVNVPLDGPGRPPLGVLEDWIEESYRIVAPKRLVRQLDQGGEPAAHQRGPRPPARRPERA
jgi:predicted DNA-binding protein (MmcQ/YjbR family)